MHPTERGLLDAVLRDPDDDGARLVYADYLEENGRDEHAEFVRVQVELANWRWTKAHTICHHEPRCRQCCRCDRCLLLYRESELLQAAEAEAERLVPHWPYEWTFRRGFVEIVVLTAADWLAHADAITAAHPVRKARLTTWPEVGHIDRDVAFMACREFLLPGGRGRYAMKFDDVMYHLHETRDLREHVALKLLANAWPGIEFELPPPHPARDVPTEDWPGWRAGGEDARVSHRLSAGDMERLRATCEAGATSSPPASS
jgi:uncharacterized protein (TIGR02996 family)